MPSFTVCTASPLCVATIVEGGGEGTVRCSIRREEEGWERGEPSTLFPQTLPLCLRRRSGQADDLARLGVDVDIVVRRAGGQARHMTPGERPRRSSSRQEREEREEIEHGWRTVMTLPTSG